MPTTDVTTWPGEDLVGSDHKKIGTIDHVYLDRETGQPTFLAVKTGLLGTRSSLVPVQGAHPTDDGVQVPADKDAVKDAPNVDVDDDLTEAEEQQLYAHYGLQYQGYDGPDHASFDGRDAGRDTAGATTDHAMTRSEEEVRIGTTQRAAGTARLRKHVVTEDVHETVPVAHEEARVVREPITDANADAAVDGPAISEEEHEVTLNAEEVVVEKRAVPKERVSLGRETVVEDVAVDETVRKEQIEADGDTHTR